ncbi:MAG TPA: hypothetical protein PKV75_01445 [Desulfobacterales bacterium]|nr:hypothetical protein [Desulfobacterales bacterium]
MTYSRFAGVEGHPGPFERFRQMPEFESCFNRPAAIADFPLHGLSLRREAIE